MTKWRLTAALLLTLTMATVPTLAEARAGGSYSSGGSGSFSSQGSRGSRTFDSNGGSTMQRSVTPRPSPSQSSPYGAQTSPGMFGSHPFLSGLAGGFIGSWIGGMLFPHWGGYGGGYGGGGFGGVLGSLLSWALIIGGIWFAFRMFSRRSRPLTSPDFGGMGFGGTPTGAPGLLGGGGGGMSRGAPMAIAAADYQAFEAILKNVQGSWTQGDLAALRHYVTPEMLSYFSEELASNESQGVTNHVEQVELLQGDLREAWDEGALQYATCYLRWRALDYTVRSSRRPGDPDYVAGGDPQRPSEAAELWTFARSPGGHWLLAAIQQV